MVSDRDAVPSTQCRRLAELDSGDDKKACGIAQVSVCGSGQYSGLRQSSTSACAVISAMCGRRTWLVDLLAPNQSRAQLRRDRLPSALPVSLARTAAVAAPPAERAKEPRLRGKPRSRRPPCMTSRRGTRAGPASPPVAQLIFSLSAPSRPLVHRLRAMARPRLLPDQARADRRTRHLSRESTPQHRNAIAPCKSLRNRERHCLQPRLPRHR